MTKSDFDFPRYETIDLNINYLMCLVYRNRKTKKILLLALELKRRTQNSKGELTDKGSPNGCAGVREDICLDSIQTANYIDR